MKWIHQVDSAFGSMVMYSPSDYFVAWSDDKGIFNYETAHTYAYLQSKADIVKRFSAWLEKQNPDFIRVIAATGELRQILRELEPSMFE